MNRIKEGDIMDVNVNGKVILITGSTQGIGHAVAMECARSGAAGIVVSGRRANAGEAVVKEIEKLGVKASMATADLLDVQASNRIFEHALSEFGRVDALVNSAGLTTRASAEEADRGTWQTLFKVNTEEPFFLMQQMIQHLKAKKRGGSIVNILSMNMHGGTKDLTVYSATKAALALITKNVAQHHRWDHIRANGINVGWADTPAERIMQAQTLGHGDGWLEEAATQQPFGRLLSAGDVARLTVYLISETSSPMTGAIIDQEQWVTGGLNA